MTLNGINIGDQVYAVLLSELKIYHSYVTVIEITENKGYIEIAKGPRVPAEQVFKTLESAQAFIVANAKVVEVKKESVVLYTSDEKTNEKPILWGDIIVK